MFLIDVELGLLTSHFGLRIGRLASRDISVNLKVKLFNF